VTPASADRGQPLLVIGYGQRSAPAMQIVEAARDLCGNPMAHRRERTRQHFHDSALEEGRNRGEHRRIVLDETTAQLRAHAPDGIVAYRDEDIVLLSLIAEELGLDYRTPGVARSLVDKLVQRDAFRVGGLPTPACWEVPADRDPAAIAAFAAEVHFPAVLKPRVGSGGQFTMPVANADDLVARLSCSHAGRRGGGDVRRAVSAEPRCRAE